MNGEGFAFFAWHRLRWPNRTEHTNGLLYPSCQRAGPCNDWVCRNIWRNGAR